MNLFRSVRFRLTFLFSCIFGAALIVTSIGSYRVVSESHQNEFDASLYNHAIDVAASISLDLVGRVRIEMEDPDQMQKRLLFPIQRSFLQIRSLEGHVLARSSNLTSEFLIPLSQKDWDLLLKAGVVFSNLLPTRLPHGREPVAKTYRMISYLVQKPDLPEMVLQIVAPMTLIEKSQDRFSSLFLVVVPLSILLAVVLGWSLSGWAFRPVKQMSKRTAEIELNNLRERLMVPNGDPELKELAETFNMLLSRVEDSIRTQERFIADASHELKTPLAIISGEIEVARSQVGLTTEQAAEVMESVSQEVSQLTRLTNNLLTLAKVDAGRSVILFHSVRLDELLIELVNRMQKIARKQDVELKFNLKQKCENSSLVRDFEIQAEPELLRSAFQNLIDNAIKYGGKKVFVTLEECDLDFVLNVEDDGVGISEQDRLQIFQRFYRNNEMALKVKGAGLGLSLVKRIIDLHHGEVSCESRAEGGTVFQIRLKKA